MVHWLRPEPCAGTAPDVLSPAQVEHWRERGYLVVDGLFPASLVTTAGKQMTALATAAERRIYLAGVDSGSSGSGRIADSGAFGP